MTPNAPPEANDTLFRRSEPQASGQPHQVRRSEPQASGQVHRARGRASNPATFEVKVLFDGECPLCVREISFLRRLDRGRGRLALEDIAAPGFDAAQYGSTQHDLMARIHGVLPDGTLIEGVEVFRRAYAAVGLGWLVAPTRWPLLRPLADAAYRWFARNRLRLTGRSAVACDSDRCAVHARGA